MAVVKGSKQYQMVVVPHRPGYKAVILVTLIFFLGVSGWFIFDFGKKEGLALKTVWMQERDEIREDLEAARDRINVMQQEIARLRIGSVIDDKANEEIQQTVESLQETIAALNEEVSFYKGVMAPNFASKGLRIESLDIATDAGDNLKYSLLLTQVVDKHDFVQGGVEISVLGRNGVNKAILTLSQMDTEKSDPVRFRFRYLQTIDGEMTLPDGFKPHEVLVVAQSSGRNSQRLERSFTWPVNGG